MSLKASAGSLQMGGEWTCHAQLVPDDLDVFPRLLNQLYLLQSL